MSLDYVAYKPCGCVSMAVDSQLAVKYFAKELDAALKAGFDIRHVSTEEIRAMPWLCRECMSKKATGRG